MTLLIVDLEATCWKTKEEQGNLPNEIIEIGIVQLDDDLKIVKSKSYCVKPRFTQVTPFCTELTGWTQDKVNNGIDIEQVLSIITCEFDFKNSQSWCSWGAYDRNKLSAEKGARGGLNSIYRIEYSPFDDVWHVNLKEEFATMFKSKPVGMAKALNMLNLPLEGRHHNGEDDALNIARILQKMY